MPRSSGRSDGANMRRTAVGGVHVKPQAVAPADRGDLRPADRSRRCAVVPALAATAIGCTPSAMSARDRLLEQVDCASAGARRWGSVRTARDPRPSMSPASSIVACASARCRSPAASMIPSRRMSPVARLSRAALSAVRLEVAPPLVIRPPAPCGSPNSSAIHRIRWSSSSVAAGESTHAAHVGVESRRQQVGGGAGGGAGTRDVRQESRVSAQRRSGPTPSAASTARSARGAAAGCVDR